jgi:hypothetical protein
LISVIFFGRQPSTSVRVYSSEVIHLKAIDLILELMAPIRCYNPRRLEPFCLRQITSGPNKEWTMKKHLVALLSMMGLASTVAPVQADALKAANEDTKAKTESKVKLDKQNAEKNAAAADAKQKSSYKWIKADSEKKAIKSGQEIKGEKNAATIKGEKTDAVKKDDKANAAVKIDKTNAAVKIDKTNAAIKGDKSNAEMKTNKSAVTVKQKTVESPK